MVRNILLAWATAAIVAAMLVQQPLFAAAARVLDAAPAARAVG
jgi:hypothetical protein